MKRTFALFLFAVFLAVTLPVSCASNPNIADTFQEKGDATSIDSLLSKGNDINEWSSSLFGYSGYAAIHIAATDSKLAEAIPELVKRGANVNLLGSGGRTPIAVAGAFRNEKAVAILLELGADPNVIDMEGLTPADVAKQNLLPREGISELLPFAIDKASYDAYVAPALSSLSKTDQKNVTSHYELNDNKDGYKLIYSFGKGESERLLQIIRQTGLLVPHTVGPLSFEYFRYLCYYLQRSYIPDLDSAYELDTAKNLFILKPAFFQSDATSKTVLAKLGAVFADYSIAIDLIIQAGGKTSIALWPGMKKDYVARCEFTEAERMAAQEKRDKMIAEQGLKKQDYGPNLEKKKK